MKVFPKNNQGFVILFAIIIATMIMLVGAGIFTSAIKESILASAATESQIALFAADTGMECALYHEFVARPAGTATAVECAGQSRNENVGNAAAGFPGLYSYDFDFNLTGFPACGDVEVVRDVTRLIDDGLGGATTILGTEVIARGYNICVGNQPDLTNPTLVERRLDAWYPYPVAPAPGP